MLTVNQLSKSFGVELVLNRISFTLSPGDRIGLIGPNGCGKTTLLRILAGIDKPDSGNYRYDPAKLRVGYLPQGLSTTPGQSVADFLSPTKAEISELSNQLENLATILSKQPDRTSQQIEYDRILSLMNQIDQNNSRLPEILAALGLKQLSLETPIDQLSGGQKTRVALAALLVYDPELYLLDEPTNHLDIEMLEWLEEWLTSKINNQKSTALIVSHDRVFLDHTVSGIFELDPNNHILKTYAGNYSAYLDQKETENERAWHDYEAQQTEIKRLRAASLQVRGDARFKRGGKGDSGDKFAKGFFSDQTKGTLRRAKHLEQRLERLLTTEKIEKPRLSWQMKLDFQDPIIKQGLQAGGRDVLTLEKVKIGYQDFPLLDPITCHVHFGERIALIGANGSGKTTLLRTIAGRLIPIEGVVHLGSNTRIGYMAQEHENLLKDWNALRTIQEITSFNDTEARSFLHKYLFSGDEVFTPIQQLSHGERARLILASLVASGCNFLLLDEPINHLDIPSRTRFEQSLRSFEGTILTVVHDRYFIEHFARKIWEIQGSELLIKWIQPDLI